MTVILWRSGRDSNPRTAFDRHTISSRARYDRFDTTPWMAAAVRSRNAACVLYTRIVRLSSTTFPLFAIFRDGLGRRVCADTAAGQRSY